MQLLETIKAASGPVSAFAVHRAALSHVWHDESGQDLVEYALVAAVLSLCAVASLQSVASKVTLIWQNLATSFAAAV